MISRLRFGRFELRESERLLLIDGQPATLGARAFDVLCALVERRDRVVRKQELLDLAWPGLVVEENNLSVQISALRRVLGMGAIATIPALGYRFTLADDAAHPAHPTPPADSAAVAAAMPRSLAALPELTTLPPPDACRMQARLSAAPVASPPGQHAALSLRWAQEASALVKIEGGVLSAAADANGLQADFSSARAAAACSHRLHHAAHQLGATTLGGLGLGLRIALLPVPGAGAAPRDPAPPLHSLAQDGQTLASTPIASQLIHRLDGDLQDLGEHHPDRLGSNARLRIYNLSAPTLEPPTVLTLHSPADNLRPTLAVVPFSPYTAQAEPISLGDILADQVIANLSKSSALNVISRLSTLGFKDRDTPVAQIAQRLAADFVVSGRYWVAGGQLNLQVEMAEARSARVLWAQTVADDERAVLHADSNLVQTLVVGITRAVFALETGRLRSTPLPDLASHSLLLAAISLLYRLSPRDFSLARSALETLHQRAPRHPAPLAWLARWHLFRVVQGWSDRRDEDGRLALDHANHALDLDPDSSLALTMLGSVNTSYLKDLDRAEMLYDQALEINPNESLAWLQKGNARSFRGDGKAALEYTQRAVSLSPLDPSSHFYQTILASAALTAQDYPRAIVAARSSARLNQSHVSTHRVLAIALAMTGRLDEARQSVAQVLRLEPTLTVAHYLAHSPGAATDIARDFARALHNAGLPLGDTTLD